MCMYGKKNLFIYVDIFPHHTGEQLRSVLDDKYTVNTQQSSRWLTSIRHYFWPGLVWCRMKNMFPCCLLCTCELNCTQLNTDLPLSCPTAGVCRGHESGFSCWLLCVLLNIHPRYKEKTRHANFANVNSLFTPFRCGKITLLLFTAEIGDFEESKCRSHLLNNNYIPDQMPLIDKIMEFHSRHMWVSWSLVKLEKGFYFIQAYFFSFTEAENPFFP